MHPGAAVSGFHPVCANATPAVAAITVLTSRTKGTMRLSTAACWHDGSAACEHRR